MSNLAQDATVTDVADMLAGSLDGEYDDALGLFIAASHVGGSSQERMVDLDLSDEGKEPKRFVILIREAE